MLTAARLAAVLLVAIPLHARAESCIWYSHDDSIRQVRTDTNQVVRIVPLRDPHRLVMNADDCGVWTLDKDDRKILRFGADGTLERIIDVRPLHPALNEVEHLRLDPHDGSLWVADDRRIFHLSPTGQLLGHFSAPGEVRRLRLALDRTLWVLGRRDLWRFDANGVLLSAHTLGSHLAGDARFFEVDSVAGLIWIVDDDDLARLQLANPGAPAFRVRLQREIRGFALDPLAGNVWAAQRESLLGFSRDGQRIATVDLEPLGIRLPEKLAFDPVTRSLWAGAERSVSRFTDAGQFVARFSARDGDEALGVPAFRVGPMLTLIRPPQDALTNNPRPEIRLGYGVTCNGESCTFPDSHFSGYQLSATLNGQPVGSAFILDLAARESSFIPPAALPQGANSFSAHVKDPFGRTSPTISSTFILDSIAPAFLTLSPAEGALLPVPQAVLQGTLDDPQATVVLEGSGLNQTGGTFSFPVTLQAGSNLFTLSAVDRAGNRTTVQRTLGFVPLPALTFSILSPATGASVSGSAVLVSGLIDAPPNTGVTVNGVIAAVIAGTFYATVPVQSGPNTITAIAKTQDGFTAQKSVSITSSGPATMEVSANSQSVLAPGKVTFQISASVGATLQSIAADFNGDGTNEIVTTNVTTPLEFTYAQPGAYIARFVLVDSSGSSITQSVQIAVGDAAALDRQLKAQWLGFGAALQSGDKATALSYLSPPAIGRYERVFDRLKNSLPQILSALSAIETSVLSNSVCEYLVTRPGLNGSTRVFFIYFSRDADGVWRIDSM